MSHATQLNLWTRELAIRFPAFSQPVLTNLALYSFGAIYAKVIGLTKVVLYLTTHLALNSHNLRKRLREFYLAAPHKSGAKQGIKRCDFDVTLAFPALLRWILALWSGRFLPLAIDVTNFQDRFHILCVSVVVQGTAIPVAWKVIPAGTKEAWNPHWKQLLTLLQPAVPSDWTVIVLSDRGLQSPTLFRSIVELGWHPIMRIKADGFFRPAGWKRFRPLTRLVRPNQIVAVSGLAFQGTRLPCTLLGRWDDGYREAWLIVTDIPPEQANGLWYGMRTWIEQGFKFLKGGGWDWEKTRIVDASRIERQWWVMAVATLWVTAVGIDEEQRQTQQAEQRRQERAMEESAAEAQARQTAKPHRQEQQQRAAQTRKTKSAMPKLGGKSKPVERHPNRGASAKKRVHRLTVLGLAALAAAWAKGENLLPQRLLPDPWPECHGEATPLREEDFL